MTETSDPDDDAGAVLSQDAPHVGLDQATDILRRLYGLRGIVEVLPSERDHNFRVRTDRRDYVLKISHPGEPRAVTNFQTMALRHIAAVDPTLPVPAVTPTLEGLLEPEVASSEGPGRIARLLTFLPGQLLIEAPRPAGQDRRLGAFLARLGRALRGFFHPAAGAGDLLWDLRQLPRVWPLVPEIADERRRSLVARTIADAAPAILPLLPRLRAQVVHNDLNPSNVVVAEGGAREVAGVIDFGDMLHGPLVCDVAIGCSYRWGDDEHPLAAAARFAAGYHAVTPLEDAEIAALFDLIRARLALTLTIVNWQVARYPDKRAYLMRMNGELWAFLDRLSGVTQDEARATFGAAIAEAGTA